MTILFVTNTLPYPPTDGVRIKTYHLLKQLSKRHKIYLISFYQKATDDLKLSCSHLKQFCEIVKLLPYELNKFRNSKILLNMFNPFSNEPFFVKEYRVREMRDAIRNFLERENIDIIHFDTICVAHYLDSIKNSIPAVFSLNDCLALCCIEEARLFPVINFIKKTKCLLQWLEVYGYEKNLCSQFEKCHVVSETDKIYLHKMNNMIDADVIPNGVDTEFYKPLNLPQDFPSLVFEGVMSAGAADYAIWFIRYVFKHVLKVIPDTRLYLVGKNPDRKLLTIAAQNKNVIVTGFVDDVRPYIDRATIFVCPVLRASGILNKVLQAMAMEKAIVGTNHGFSGIRGAVNGQNMVSADNPRQFADEIINLIHNEEKRKLIGKNARTLVKNSYSWEKTAENFESLYQKAIEKFHSVFSVYADTNIKKEKKIFPIISKESCKI